jgi:Tfp pilus assembly protein PilZ
MNKRQCHRFNIPGTTLYYKKNTLLQAKGEYPDEYFPVLDISRGGARFLTNERIKVGLPVRIKLAIPDTEQQPEINAIVRWVSRNREESYRYQTGVSFNPYGNGKKANPAEVLDFIKTLEAENPAAE